MTEAELITSMRAPGSRSRTDRKLRPFYAVLPIILALAVGSSAHAGEGKWTLQLEPMYMEASGHDQHVLTIREIDLAAAPQAAQQTAVNLDTEAGVAFRLELQHSRSKWGWGIDYFSFVTSQSTPNRTAAAGPSGTLDQFAFETANQSFTSSDPSEILIYGVLEDTDLEVWTVDLYAMRTLAQKSASGLHLQFGLRLADFDNDYHAALGVQDDDGARLDASSNYDLMMGPLVGLTGDLYRGKNHIEGYLGQSVVFGTAELSSGSTEFSGSFTGMPSFSDSERFKKQEDVTIPITELRIKWTYRVSKMVSLGVGANTSVWWDVSVPPGVIPGMGLEALHENTIVFFGVLGAVELTF